MYEAVLFDMDGVIIDSEPIRQKLEKQLFHKLNLPVTEKEHQTYVGATSQGMWSRIKQKHPTDYSVEELIELEQTNYLNSLENSDEQQPMPGVVSLIEDLHKNGMKLAVASSASMKNIEIVVNKFDLNKFFTLKISGEEVPHGKPAPDVFLEAAKRIGVEPEKCIVIEDAMNGVEAAKAAGMKCVGINSAHRVPQDLNKADLVITSFQEIDFQKLQNI